MAGVGEGKQHIVIESEAAVIAIGYEMAHGFIDVMLGIERLDEVFLAFLFMRVLAVDLLVIGSHILLLDEGGVGEHKGA